MGAEQAVAKLPGHLGTAPYLRRKDNLSGREKEAGIASAKAEQSLRKEVWEVQGGCRAA